MKSRSADMRAIFGALSENNKDIVVLVAKSMKFAQTAALQPRRPPKQATGFISADN